MNDFPFALTYDDVLLRPQKSNVKSRSLVELTTNITPNIQLNFPITAPNMDTITNVEFSKKIADFGGVAFYPRFMSPNEQLVQVKKVLDDDLLVIPSVGIKENEYERAKLLVENDIKVLLVDVAHGHLQTCLDMVSKIKDNYPKVELIAGNVATYEGAKDLFKAGADCVKVGVGPGTTCTTRKVSGSGVPQITATIEASKAAEEEKGYVITDGGMRTSGDVVKALAAGANAIMTGRLVAGCKECPGDIIEKNGEKYKMYNGSTSKTEKKKQVEKYEEGKDNNYVEHVEGVESLVEYKGELKNVLSSLEMGLRSGLSYSGAFNIEELHRNAQFIRVSPLSAGRNGPHSVQKY